MPTGFTVVRVEIRVKSIISKGTKSVIIIVMWHSCVKKYCGFDTGTCFARTLVPQGVAGVERVETVYVPDLYSIFFAQQIALPGIPRYCWGLYNKASLRREDQRYLLAGIFAM